MQTQRCLKCGQDWWDAHTCPLQLTAAQAPTSGLDATLAKWTAAANKLHAAIPGVRKALDDLNGKTQAREDAAALNAVRQAVQSYYAALDRREHGGMAQDKAFRAIEQAMGMQWIQGASIRSKMPNVAEDR